MGLIAPGKNVVCIQTISCLCGCAKATKDAVYMCEVVTLGDINHFMLCRTEGCMNVVLLLSGKEHYLCACCFKPLDDGDTSLAQKSVLQEIADAWEPEPVA